jgi:hypothetical protein
MMWRVLSARTGRLRLAGPWVCFQCADDLVEVAEDLPVHLAQAGLAAGLGRGDDLQHLLAVLAVPGQELGRGYEHRACQTRVCMRAAFLHGQAAVAVRQASDVILATGG